MTKRNPLIFILSLAVAGTFLLPTAKAEQKSSRKSATQEEAPIIYRRAETESSGRDERFALGLSTLQIGLPAATNFFNGTSLTGIWELDRLNLVQVFIAIPQTSPFNIGGSAFLKHSIVQHATSGFHIGAGIGAANLNDVGVIGPNLAMSFSAIGGFHFEMPGVPHVLVHLDGGATYYFINTSPNSSTRNFTLNALSPALGASILYAF
jgi:hypothetical protein